MSCVYPCVSAGSNVDGVMTFFSLQGAASLRRSAALCRESLRESVTLLKKIERTAAQVRSICCTMVSAKTKIATREVSENGGAVLLGDGGLRFVGEREKYALCSRYSPRFLPASV